MPDTFMTSTDDSEWPDVDVWGKRGFGKLPETTDITSLVEVILDNMQNKVAEVHEGLVTKSTPVSLAIMAMDRRLDLLEQHISELIEYVTQPPGED